MRKALGAVRPQRRANSDSRRLTGGFLVWRSAVIVLAGGAAFGPLNHAFWSRRPFSQTLFLDQLI
jgi:hypothetical protein